MSKYHLCYIICCIICKIIFNTKDLEDEDEDEAEQLLSFEEYPTEEDGICCWFGNGMFQFAIWNTEVS